MFYDRHSTLVHRCRKILSLICNTTNQINEGFIVFLTSKPLPDWAQRIGRNKGW